jgi:hypothetical protein
VRYFYLAFLVTWGTLAAALAVALGCALVDAGANPSWVLGLGTCAAGAGCCLVGAWVVFLVEWVFAPPRNPRPGCRRPHLCHPLPEEACHQNGPT